MMIRPATAAVLLLLGVLATAAAAPADAVPDAAVKEEGRGLRGLVNKIVSPLTDQIYNPTRPVDPVYNPTRPRTDTHVRIDQFGKADPAPYNPTRPVKPEPIDPTKTTSF